ncbi:MAG: hypothetical protein A2V70_18630 [Planctomycetes bacterium RBG_13_63_9]|nr:MAG: hypothetical protein A2V70_18630 [Planctomycetes bacterium RBG_13_63_9]
MGRGRGQGARPEEQDDTASYDSQAPAKINKKGSAVVTDLVRGPNVKGEVQQDIKQQLDTVRQGDTNPLTGRRIPKKHRQHAREYFDRFREGE